MPRGHKLYEGREWTPNVGAFRTNHLQGAERSGDHKGCGNGAAVRKSVGETMATNEDLPGTDGGQPVVGTDHQVDTPQPRPAANSRSRSFLHDGLLADAAVEPAARGFDRSLWPDLR